MIHKLVHVSYDSLHRKCTVYTFCLMSSDAKKHARDSLAEQSCLGYRENVVGNHLISITRPNNPYVNECKHWECLQVLVGD